MGQTFFGLTYKDRTAVFTEIHEIVLKGGGGYSWGDVYSMPVRIREFVYGELVKYYKKPEETSKKTENSKKVLKVPTYISKASK